MEDIIPAPLPLLLAGWWYAPHSLIDISYGWLDCLLTLT